MLSPKFHNQEIGLPVDVSMNCTACPGVGEEGLKVKDAAIEGATVIVWLTVLEPELKPTVKVTV